MPKSANLIKVSTVCTRRRYNVNSYIFCLELGAVQSGVRWTLPTPLLRHCRLTTANDRFTSAAADVLASIIIVGLVYTQLRRQIASSKLAAGA